MVRPRTVILKTPNSVIPTKLLVGISMLLLHGSPRRTENLSTVNQFFLLLRTSNPRPPTPAFIATHILELATVLFGERRTSQRSTSFFALTNLQPRTSDPGLICNSHLATALFGEQRTLPDPYSLALLLIRSILSSQDFS